MPTEFKRGLDTPQLRRRTYKYTPGKGLTQDIDMRGITPAKVITEFNALVPLSSGATLTIEDGRASISASFGVDASGNVPNSNDLSLSQDRWEMPCESEEIEIWQNPAVQLAAAIYAGVTISDASNLPIISKWIAVLRGSSQQTTPVDSDEIFAADSILMPGWATFATSHPTSAATIKAYYALACTGSNHYRRTRWTLQHTTSAPAYWTRNIADVGVNCIYTPAQFLSEVNDSSLWRNPIPTRLYYKANQAGLAFPDLRGGYLWGWLKSASSESYSGGGRIDIQTSYALDQWSTLLYGTI